MALLSLPLLFSSRERPPSTPLVYRAVPKNILLIALSIFCLPISLALVAFSLIHTRLYGTPIQDCFSFHLPFEPEDAPKPKKILITGVSMTKGLAIARLLSVHTKHRLIGADISPLSPGRFSDSLLRFYTLDAPVGNDPEPYIDSLLTVIKQERVDLWISCSSVVAAEEDGEVAQVAARNTARNFRAIQFDSPVVSVLHSKDRFIDYSSQIGLRVPQSYRCTSADKVLEILSNSKGDRDAFRPYKKRSKKRARDQDRKFILKPIGVDDKARAQMLTLLPLSTAAQTADYVRSLAISASNPFQLQHYIGGKEYCTHALIIHGRVTAFVACPSSDMLMHYSALPLSSRLAQQMLSFTTEIAANQGANFTGHLSFDFLADGEGDRARLYAVECNPRAHTAVCLFGESEEMAKAYLSVFDFSPPSRDDEDKSPFSSPVGSGSEESGGSYLSYCSSSSSSSSSSSLASSASASASEADDENAPIDEMIEQGEKANQEDEVEEGVVQQQEEEKGKKKAYDKVNDNDSANDDNDDDDDDDTYNENEPPTTATSTSTSPHPKETQQSTDHPASSPSPLPLKKRRSKPPQPLIITPSSPAHSYYWLGHDLVVLFLLPLLSLLSHFTPFAFFSSSSSSSSQQASVAAPPFSPWSFAKSLSEFERGTVEFVRHLVYWREATFRTWDPWPFFVLYHVYWPMRFWEAVWGRGWSRVNVSTTKVFEC